MILVFCEFGGERLLGKAREMADSMGLSVIAICSSERGTDEFSQKLISLGADEVTRYNNPKTVFEWSQAISQHLKNQTRIRFLLSVSGLYTDAILARVYALSKDRIGCFASGVDGIDGNYVVKNIHSWGTTLRFEIKDEETCLLSFNPASIPQPFEDSTRYGKTTDMNFSFAISSSSPNLSGLKEGAYFDGFGTVTILAGKIWAEKKEESESLKRIATKYKAKIVIQSSQVEEIYGPCLAIDVQGLAERELPRFHGELIAINSSEGQIISKLADTSVVTSELSKVLKKL